MNEPAILKCQKIFKQFQESTIQHLDKFNFQETASDYIDELSYFAAVVGIDKKELQFCFDTLKSENDGSCNVDLSFLFAKIKDHRSSVLSQQTNPVRQDVVEYYETTKSRVAEWIEQINNFLDRKMLSAEVIQWESSREQSKRDKWTIGIAILAIVVTIIIAAWPYLLQFILGFIK